MTLEMTLEDLAWPSEWPNGLGPLYSPTLYNDAYREGRQNAISDIVKALDNWPWLSISPDIDRALEALVSRKMEREREGLRQLRQAVEALITLLEQEGVEAPELDAVKRLLPKETK